MDLRNTQLKDTYGNLVTTGTTAGSPTTGGLQNGQGTLLTSVGIGTDSPNALLELSGRSDTGDITMRFADKDGGVLTGQDHSNIEYFATDGSAVSAEVKTIYADVVGGLDYTISTRAGGGSLAERLRIRSTGDISFRDGSASEAFYWDASAGSLGIGTTSPTEKLQIVDSANDVHVRIGSGNAGINPTLRFHGKNTADTTNVYADIRINPDNQTLGFSGTGTSGGSIEQDALVIDSSGQVGIGTDNPATRLDIQGVGGATTSPSVTATTGTSYIGWKSVNTGGSFWTAIDNSTGSSFSTNTAYARVLWSNGAYPMVFSTNSTERMRIDSSGNVVVGKGTADNTTAGVTMYGAIAPGNVSMVRSNGNVLILNRLTNDGDIAVFRKDGTTVGNIGASGGRLYIGSDDTSIFFDSGDSPSIRPHGPVDPDGVIDIGDSGARFKDLYLSGSVYLGGTTSANALDDYEEGTFELTLNGSTSNPTTAVTTTAHYTKIGNVVHYNFRFENVDTTGASGNITFSGFPFTTTSTNNSSGAVDIFQMANFNGAEYLNLYIGSTTTAGEVLGTRSNNGWINPQHNVGTGRYINASITVHVV
jgi:hypothetical protein